MARRRVFEVDNDLNKVDRVVGRLIDHCRELGFDESRLRLNLRVGVTEALVNAILYGNERDPGKSVRLEASFALDAVVVTVTDQGHGFDPEALPDPTLPRNVRRTGGRGIYLIRKLMDEVEFSPQGNSITMVLHAMAPHDVGSRR